MIEALSRPPVIHDSPQTHQQEVQDYPSFPTSKEEFRNYLDNLPLGQRFVEGLMFGEDVEMARREAADFLLWQTVENTTASLAGRVSVGNKGMVVVSTGFGSHESAYWGLKDYLGNRGYRVLIYHPGAIINVKPMGQLSDGYTQFLVRVKKEVGDRDELYVIAHSKGAILNMATAIKYPDLHRSLVSKNINLGGPIPQWVNSTIGRWYLGWLDYFGGDDFEMTRLLDSAHVLDSMNFTSIGNLKDRIIKGRHVGGFIEIEGSHSGMPFNRREVLPKIPQILNRRKALAA